MTTLAAREAFRDVRIARVRDAVWCVLFAVVAAVGGVATAVSPRIGLGIAGVFALGWLAVAWRFAVALLIVLSCVDGFIKKYHPSPATYVMKDAVLVAIVIGVLGYLSSSNWVRTAFRDRRAWPMAFYVVAMTAMLGNPGIGVFPAIAGFRERVLFSVLFFVGIVYFDSAARLVRTWYLVIGGIAFASLTGVAQLLLGDVWTHLGPAFTRAAMHYNSFNIRMTAGEALTLSARAYGTLVDPAALGLAAGFGIVLGCAAIPFTRGRGRYALVAAIFAMMYGMMLSGARAGMVTALAGFVFLIFAFIRRPATRPYALVAIVVMMLAIPAGYAATAKANSARFAASTAGVEATYRLRSVAVAVERMASHPLGAGLGSTGAGGSFRANPAETLRGLDNLFMAYLYEVGPLGFAAFMIAQIWLLVTALKRAGTAATLRIACIYNGLAAAQIGLLANGLLSQGSFDYAPVAQAFWLLAGSVLVSPHILEPASIEGETCPS